MDGKKLLVLILLFIAFGLLLAAVFYPIPIAEEGEVQEFLERQEANEELPESEAIEQETSLWTTSRNHFTIEVPAEWDIQQRDAGDMSVISIFDPDEEDVVLEIHLGLTSSLDGAPISLQEFINTQLLEVELIKDCDETMIGDEDAECFIATFDDDVKTVYFGQVDALTYFYVAKDLEEFKATPMQEVLNTLNFNPDKHTLSEAETIP